MSLFPERQNPVLDAELAREPVQFFMRYGCLVVEDAISRRSAAEQLQRLRAAMDGALAWKEREAATDIKGSDAPSESAALSNRLFGELLEEDPRFEFLLDNEPVLYLRISIPLYYLRQS